MKKTILFLALAITTSFAFAQKKLVTTSATISFDATTSIDALPKATNNTVIASLDPKTGAVAFEATIKGFNFTNPKIQEHFNGKGWMDSDQFALATFKGKLSDLKKVNFKKNGTYKVPVTGILTIHGVSNAVTSVATVVVNGKKISTNSDFSIALADYKVSGGAIGAGKVAKNPTINVQADF